MMSAGALTERADRMVRAIDEPFDIDSQRPEPG
jgi:hypothetical protein